MSKSLSLKRSSLLAAFTLLFALLLTACGSNAPAATPTAKSASGLPAFPSFKEVTLDKDVTAALLKTLPGVPGNPQLSFFISDEADQTKLASEVDKTLTGVGYKVPDAMKSSGMALPGIGLYAKAGAPDVFYLIGSVSDVTKDGMKGSGLSDAQVQSLTNQIKDKKSVMITITGQGLVDQSLGGAGSSTPSSGTPGASMDTGVNFGLSYPSGFDSLFFSESQIKDAFAKTFPGTPKPILFFYGTDEADLAKVANTMHESLTNANGYAAIASQPKPLKKDTYYTGFYTKAGAPDAFFTAYSVTDFLAQDFTSMKNNGLTDADFQKMSDTLKTKKSVVIVAGAPNLVKALNP